MKNKAFKDWQLMCNSSDFVDLVTRIAPTATLKNASGTSQEIKIGVGIAIVNYNTTLQTMRCLESLRQSRLAPDWVYVLDNGSQPDNISTAFEQLLPYKHSVLCLFRSKKNLGFAGGSNILIERLLAEPSCKYIVLLNNDAVAMPELISCLTEVISSSPIVGMAGGRMHKLHEPEQVDTLGIALYASLMPADRHSIADRYIGPTGGCAIVSRMCLDSLKQTAGYWFDPRFFCYCEDTDLVLRAVLLGYRPAFIDKILALHEGQASSGGGYNHFIIYHGLRNSIWMIAKLIPSSLLIKYGILFLFAQFLTIVRHLIAGNPLLLLRIYRDALSRLPELIHERHNLQGDRKIAASLIDDRISRRFYRNGYLRLVFKELLKIYKIKWFTKIFCKNSKRAS